MEADLREARVAFERIVSLRFPNLSGGTKDQLWEALGSFTTQVAIDYFTKLGEFELPTLATQIMRNTFEQGTFDLGNPQMREIAEATFVDFLTDDPAGEVFFAAHMSSCIFAFRTSTSAEVSGNINQVLKGSALFLDRNILITLIGLTGEDETPRSVRKLL